jgi:hypothetical protein
VLHPRLAAVHVAILVALLMAACVAAESLPATCGDPSVTVTAELHGEEMTPNRLDVCRDQHVTLQITSDREGILHLHGYDQEAPAQQVSAGDTATFEFHAVRSGQFVIELHPTDGPDEVELGFLTVHEH